MLSGHAKTSVRSTGTNLISTILDQESPHPSVRVVEEERCAASCMVP